MNCYLNLKVGDIVLVKNKFSGSEKIIASNIKISESKCFLNGDYKYYRYGYEEDCVAIVKKVEKTKMSGKIIELIFYSYKFSADRTKRVVGIARLWEERESLKIIKKLNWLEKIKHIKEIEKLKRCPVH